MFLRVLDSHQWLPGFVTSLTLLGHTKLRLGELPKNWTRPSKTSSFTNIPKTTGLAPLLSNSNLVAVEYFSYFFLSQGMIVAGTGEIYFRHFSQGQIMGMRRSL